MPAPPGQAVSVARRRRRVASGPGVAQATPRAVSAEQASTIAPTDDGDAMIALVAALAELAADLWFDGRLQNLPAHEERGDAEDD